MLDKNKLLIKKSKLIYMISVWEPKEELVTFQLL